MTGARYPDDVTESKHGPGRDGGESYGCVTARRPEHRARYAGPLRIGWYPADYKVPKGARGMSAPEPGTAIALIHPDAARRHHNALRKTLERRESPAPVTET